MQTTTRLTTSTSQTIGITLRIVMLAMLLTTSLEAGTLYWGGGSANITGPQALPKSLGNLTGTWNTTLQNWAVDTNGTSYQAWSNTGTSNTAYFGAGLTNDTASATITLTENLTVNKLDLRDPGPANKVITFATATPVTLTLNGATPTVNLYGAAVNWQAIFPANVAWAGTAGLNYTGFNGWFQIYGDASQLTGPIMQSALGAGAFMNFNPGSKLGSTDIKLSTGSFYLSSANGANNTAFSDNAVVSFISNGSGFGMRSWAGATASTETIGKVLLAAGFGTLDASLRSGGSGTNGKFILGDATAGIDRGPHGKGMIALVTQTDGSILTDVVVSNGVATGVLPWAMNNLGRLVQLDATDKVLKVVANTDAPTDVTTWVADTDYRMTNAPTGTRNTLTLNSLTAFFSGISPTLTLGDNQTLTLTRGLLGIQRTGTTVVPTITNGVITTPASTLYIHLGTTAAGINLYSRIDGSFNLVIGGSGASATIGGAVSNTFVGTTYLSCSTFTFAKPTAYAPAINGDLVLLGGNVFYCGAPSQNQIPRTANVTIEELGTMTGGGNAGTQDFGGNVTINGGVWLGNFSTSHHAFDAAGFGLRFNGGRFGNAAATGYGNYYLLTDVSYASTSTRQAVFENTSMSQLLNLTELTKGAATRTFSITNSTTLDAATPEMAIYANLYEANTSEKGGLTKAGSGVLSVRGMTYYLSGDITINAGTLIAAGGWNAVSRAGTTISASAVVTGLSATSDLVVGQKVTGTGIPATTSIFSIDSDSQITLSQNATASGTPTLTFAARGGVGKAQVLAGTRTITSPIVTGLSSTAGMAVGQPVSGTGIPGSTTISNINSATEIALSANATASGTSDLTFLGGSAVGRGPVTVNSGGTLAGEGVAGNVTVKSGGILSAGITTNTMATLQVGGNLTVESGGTLAVDVTTGTNDAVTVLGNADITGATLAVNGPKPAVGTTFTILTSPNIIGSFATIPDGFAVRTVGNQLQLSRQVVGFSFSVQ